MRLLYIVLQFEKSPIYCVGFVDINIIASQIPIQPLDHRCSEKSTNLLNFNILRHGVS